jgi:DDE superfamily endonuclease
MVPRDLGRGKKNAKKRQAWIVFLDESGLSQKPPVRRTWAPRGQTPVLRHAFNWKKLSICSALAYRWDGRKIRLLFSIVADSYTDKKLIYFLAQARKEFRHRRLIIIWDGLPSHRSRLMKQYLDTQRRWLTVVRLPPYAPDLNPVEFAWGNIQGKELANLCSDDLGAMVSGVRKGFARVCKNKSLPQSFLQHAGISFSDKVQNLCKAQ